MIVAALFLFGAVVWGYACGLFPSGPWVARRSLGGRNLTELGSGSTGATNVLRYAGWGMAFAVVVLDVLKAVVAILLVRYVADFLALRFEDGNGNGNGNGNLDILAWGEAGAAVGCLLGHCFPVWSARFRGGKGVASMVGVVLLLVPWMFFVSALLWVGVLGLWGFSSVASLAVCLFLVVGGLFWVGGVPFWGLVGVVVVVLVRHRENMARLWRGEEGRVFGGLWRRLRR